MTAETAVPILAILAVCSVSACAVALRRRSRRLTATTRELHRMQARLQTFIGVLAPIPGQVRAGGPIRLTSRDLATIAVLVEHEGPEGEQLLALEALFHQNSGI